MFGNLFNQKTDQSAVDPNQLPQQPTVNQQNVGVVGQNPPANDPAAIGQPPAFPGQPPSAMPQQPIGGSQPVSTPPANDFMNMSTGSGTAPVSQVPMQENPVQSASQMSQNPASNTGENPSEAAGATPDAAAHGLIASTMDPSLRGNVSALSRLDPRATQVLNNAQQETKRIQQQLIEPQQLLYGLLFDGDIYRLLEQFEIDASALSEQIKQNEQQGTFTGQPTLSNDTKAIFDKAYNLSKNRGASFLSPEDLLLALFDTATTSDFLKAQGVEKTKVEEKLSKSVEYSTGKRSVLDKYGIDLTEQAKQGTLDPIVGRDRELKRLTHILLRRTKNNPIIIGEAGVGKTAIVEALAQKIVEGSVPEELKEKKIIQLEISSLIAGASRRGEFEERLRGVIKEIQASSGNIVLFVDEIHTLVGAGDTQGALDASNIIKPFLARGQLQLIGTTTTSEFRKYFEKDKAFERRFQPILVEEPSEEVAIEMMEVVKPKYENYHHVTISQEGLEAAVKLSKKYIGERFLPDKAVDLIDEASAEVKLAKAEGKREDTEVKKSDIESVVSNWTGIPITRLTEDESQKLLKLEDLIHERLIDQQQAVVAVAEAVRRGRIGLSSANRPIASFIFLGPTGVGKTELAKTLAVILFGKEDAMIRLDMSEYMEKHEVAKLIGAPPGYVGYEEGGQLTEAVRTKPYSIVLLDEVEKAHPDVFNIMLQLLEDGRLTDNKGNTISFKNTIVIATSNLGSQLIQKYLGEAAAQKAEKKEEKKDEKETGKEQAAALLKEGEKPEEKQEAALPVKEAEKEEGQVKEGVVEAPEIDEQKFEELNKILLDELHKFFRPELLNRFDGLVVFKPLSQKDMASIAKLSIEKTKKLLSEQGYDLQITQKALDVLAKEGYDPVYGARPLRRLIQTAIENPISIEIISKNFNQGDIILIDYDTVKEEYTFTKKAPEPNTSPAGQVPSETNKLEDEQKGEGQNAPAQVDGATMTESGAQNQAAPVESQNNSGRGVATNDTQTPPAAPTANDMMFPVSPEVNTQNTPSVSSGSSPAQNGILSGGQPADAQPQNPNVTLPDANKGTGGQMMQPQ